ncbi:hypothetical protein ACP70R_039992 [Stipagrostis hirtigluma subsp. patula]
MKKKRGPWSPRRSLEDPTMDSNARGSEGVMTRARRRRLLAESCERLGRKTEAPAVQDPWEWRDWANLLPELVDEISGRLLSLDVAEYLRFRAVCRPWRGLTADPRSGPLDSRFRPRNWAVLTITQNAGPRRHLLNLSTAASLRVDIPALSTHCHLCAADGLLVLFDRATKAIRLVDPLSNAITNFPAMAELFQNARGMNPRLINGAGFDDSTSPPSLVLCLRDIVSTAIFAQPGDARWTPVTPGQASYSRYDSSGKVLFHSLLSRRGRCYLASPEGSVYFLELRPLPRLVEVVDQRPMCPPDTHHLKRVISFLINGDVHGDDGGRMLMVRYWRNVEYFGGKGAYKPTELFTVGGQTGRIEVMEVDIPGRRLVPVRSLGRRRAVFVGETHCVLVSTETFPSVATDVIYLGYRNQRIMKFSAYHLSTRRTEPPHQFRLDDHCRLLPYARPCNLDQYLACYVDRSHGLSGECINHANHNIC